MLETLGLSLEIRLENVIFSTDEGTSYQWWYCRGQCYKTGHVYFGSADTPAEAIMKLDEQWRNS